MSNDGKLLLSVREASTLLGVSRNLVYEMVRRDEIPHLRLGRLVKTPRQGLESWIAQESGVAENGETVLDLPQGAGPSAEGRP